MTVATISPGASPTTATLAANRAALFLYFTRCIPAFSIIGLFTLLACSLILSPFGRGEKGRHNGEATWPQLVLAGWTVLLHICSIAFPIRVCWAIRDVIKRIRDSASVAPNTRRRRVQSIKNEQGIEQHPVPLFAIILPAYKEEVSTMEETLRVLAAHAQARYCYHVYLAMEEKEEKAAVKAAQLCSTFDNSFLRISYTIHPADIAGEAQGKSSNEAWAAKQILLDYPQETIKQNVIVTTMDADTHLSPRYFTQIARMHVESAATNQTSIYVPPMVFDRNLHHVPLPVRTADLMWAGAGISSLHSGATVCIPTSVYSLPLGLIEHVGGWDTGPGAIGEDMHMYLKCFFALSGNLTVQIVYAAASQCDVSSDKKGALGYIDGLTARYKQALRHMWGSLDTGYAIRETVKMFDRHRQASQSRVDFPLSAPNANWTAFYTSTGLHRSLTTKHIDVEQLSPMPINRINLFTLFYRLFEAHFLPAHLAVIMTTTSLYGLVYPTFLMPRVLRLALEFSGWCRLIGFCIVICFFYFYDRYHRLCVALRREEMRHAGMLEDMQEHDSFTPGIFQVAGLFETATFPIGGFIFGAIPAMHAVVMHLFTDRLTYVVSLKPQLVLRPWREAGRLSP